MIIFSCKSSQETPFVFRVSLWANEDHTWYKAFMHFADALEQQSDGRMVAEIYPSEQMAKETESIRLIQAEVIEMTVTGSLLSNWIEIAAFCELPFLLQDTIDRNLLVNGPLGKRIEDEFLQKTGLRIVGRFDRGPRQLTSNRPIKHPDDLDGLIIRVPNVPSFVTAWNTMGAKPTPMALTEVFTSLQQGTIEAQENPFSLILSAGFPEVQDYVNLTSHVISWSYPVVREHAFQRLTPELQGIFLKCAREMEHYERELFMESELQVQQALKDRGMEFIEVDKSAFAAKCEEAIFTSLSQEMQGVYRDFLQYRDQKRDG